MRARLGDQRAAHRRTRITPPADPAGAGDDEPDGVPSRTAQKTRSLRNMRCASAGSSHRLAAGSPAGFGTLPSYTAKARAAWRRSHSRRPCRGHAPRARSPRASVHPALEHRSSPRPSGPSASVRFSRDTSTRRALATWSWIQGAAPATDARPAEHRAPCGRGSSSGDARSAARSSPPAPPAGTSRTPDRSLTPRVGPTLDLQRQIGSVDSVSATGHLTLNFEAA